MKTPFKIIVLALALSGCTSTVHTVERIIYPPRFTELELGALADVRQLVEKVEVCGNTQEQLLLAQKLQTKVDWVKKFAEFVPNNDDSVKMLTAFSKEADLFLEASKKQTSEFFCKESLTNFNEQATMIQKALGNKG